MFPDVHGGVQLKELISFLLEKDLKKRYGCLKDGAGDIKRHKFFSRTVIVLVDPFHTLPQ